MDNTGYRAGQAKQVALIVVTTHERLTHAAVLGARGRNINRQSVMRFVSRCGLAGRREAGKLKNLGSIRFSSPFSSKIVVYGHCLVTLPTRVMKH